MHTFTQLALIGSTASGKTSLSLKLAQHYNAHILSIDSLSVYKEIDIVSAKPTLEERGDIVHFGIDHISPNTPFDVTLFIKLYHEVYARCVQEGKNLIIVGGTSFYLKMLIGGISTLPTITQQTKYKTQNYLQDLTQTHAWLSSLDPQTMQSIEVGDSYRIEKALNIYLQTQQTPSQYFAKNPPTPTISLPLPIYQIVWDRTLLRERIALRTKIMIKEGVIDEVCALEKKYTRSPNAMKAIGIKETLAFLDGIYDKKMLLEKITTNTARLAKRQNTFNHSQFQNVTKGSVEEIEKILFN